MYRCKMWKIGQKECFFLPFLVQWSECGCNQSFTIHYWLPIIQTYRQIYRHVKKKNEYTECIKCIFHQWQQDALYIINDYTIVIPVTEVASTLIYQQWFGNKNLASAYLTRSLSFCTVCWAHQLYFEGSRLLVITCFSGPRRGIWWFICHVNPAGHQVIPQSFVGNVVQGWKINPR